ncbi:MAG: flippase [Ignavibacteria bacterium]
MSYLPDKLLPYRTIFKNFTSLSILQIANYLFPLIVLPYIVRVIGPSKYGLINFAAAFVAYFNIICDYGFNISGTKQISIIRDDKIKLNITYSNIVTIRILLSVIGLIILLLLVNLIDMFDVNRTVFLLSYGTVIGYALFPGWFFQGIEQMKYITIIQLIIRSIVTALIFILIKEEGDFILLILLNSLAQIVIGICGLIVAKTKFQIKFSFPKFRELRIQLKEGFSIFSSTVAINLYTTSNTFILGLFASETIVGFYAAADKIRIAFQGIQSVLSQTVFPHVNNLFKKSRQEYLIFIRKLMKLQVVLGFCISLILFVFSKEISDIILGEQFLSSAVLLRIISPLPFLISISNIYGIQIMLPMGLESIFNKIISLAAFIHLIILLILVPMFSAVGTSAAVVFTEFLISMIMLLYIRKRRILLN